MKKLLMAEKEEKEKEKPLERAERVDEGKELKKDLEKTEKEKDEYLDGWKRAKADLINYKKDELKRLEEVARFGSESLILELISILDDFDLALATLEKQGTAEKGVYLIRSRFEDILKRRGLERIKVETGDKFDPVIHEAISVMDSGPASADSASVATPAKEAATAGKTENTLAEEIEAGYTLHGKVIRPARVKVWASPKN